ncbi:serine hydrolase domain-containing protein [Fodinicola acaciae]|uniref:serine hydrolase domain-containing protein n=1 Tax=Fodinicola acaciae TaxID=2681555 RepID=UPI0013D4826D|nr:serine hydrolase domain-containing protein [Fodinicola acaciae]
MSVQQLLDRAVSNGEVPGILAQVWHNGDTWCGTAGVSDLESGRTRQPGDHFRIGSATKTFVAVIVLRLVADGRLSLDDTVDTWLPGVVRGNGHDGRRITVRQLLNHTSGLFNYAMDPVLIERYYTPALLEHRFDGYTPEQLVAYAMAHPPLFEPGTDWMYCNTGYVLAGMIIERITGTTFGEELKRIVTGPLELSGTYMPSRGDSGIAVPHGRYYSNLSVSRPEARIHDLTEMNVSMAWTGGGMISTAGDMLRFFGELLAGRLLPPEQQREMFTTVPTHDWHPKLPGAGYGLGVASIVLPDGTTLWGNGGAINGSWSYVFGRRDGSHLIAANVNADWTYGDWSDPIGVFTDLVAAEFG